MYRRAIVIHDGPSFRVTSWGGGAAYQIDRKDDGATALLMDEASTRDIRESIDADLPFDDICIAYEHILDACR